jgi:hypothetical protein
LIAGGSGALVDDELVLVALAEPGFAELETDVFDEDDPHAAIARAANGARSSDRERLIVGRERRPPGRR